MCPRPKPQAARSTISARPRSTRSRPSATERARAVGSVQDQKGLVLASSCGVAVICNNNDIYLLIPLYLFICLFVYCCALASSRLFIFLLPYPLLACFLHTCHRYIIIITFPDCLGCCRLPPSLLVRLALLPSVIALFPLFGPCLPVLPPVTSSGPVL